jgi:hypothetical protein
MGRFFNMAAMTVVVTGKCKGEFSECCHVLSWPENVKKFSFNLPISLVTCDQTLIIWTGYNLAVSDGQNAEKFRKSNRAVADCPIERIFGGLLLAITYFF